MKSRINLFLVNALIVTLTIIFSTCLFLAQIRDDALQLAKQEQEQAIQTLWQLLRAKGSDFRIVDGRLMAGSYVINGNYELPDTIREIFGGTATIFMGDTRVSTNVLTADGARAVGTKLTGPAHDAIFKENLPYRGEAPILGIPYFTAYDPIRNRNGETIGVLYVGVKKSEFLTAYSRLKFNIIAGTVVIEVLFIALGFVLLWERNRYEELLRESEQKYHTLFENSAEGIFLLNDTFTFLDCNEQAARLFGCSRTEIIGKYPLDFSPPVQPDGRPSAVAAQQLAAFALTGSPPFFPWQHQRGDEALIDTEISLNALKIKGRTVLQATMRDITEQVQTEARIREVARVLSETTGETFFSSLAENIARLLQAEYAFIGELVDDARDTVRVIASFAHGKAAETFSYTLAGTPCAEVVKGSSLFYPEGVSRHYPDNRLLADMNAEGFLGTPLKLADGRVVGVVAVLDSKPLRRRHDTESILQLFAVRAAAELNRLQTETRLQEMADSLQTQFSFLQTLIDTIPSPIFYKDRAGRYLGCNLAFGNHLGLEREQLVGKTVYDLAPPDLADRYHEMDEALVANRGVQVYESSVLYADGIRHDVIFNKATFTNADGGVGGLVGVILDVTERKKAEDMLAEREEFLSNILDSIQDGISILDADLRLIRANPVIERRFSGGMPIVGRICHEAYHGRSEPCEPCPSLETLRSGQPSFKIFSCVENETEIWLELYTFPLFDSKKSRITGVIEYTRDVTERKRAEEALRESEERFHQVFAQNFDAIILFQINSLSIIDANPMAEELTGYSRNELRRLTPDSIIAPKDFHRLMDSIPIDDYSRGFQLDKGVCLRKDGSTTFISVWSKIIMLRDDFVVYCSIRDITEKTRLEEEIRTTQAKLIHANKMTSLGMLASSIAHEINNPNNYIAVNASMLADAWQDAAPVLRRQREEHGDFPVGGLPCSEMEELAPRLFTGIAEGSRRINAIVTNMKDYVKPDERSQHVEFDVNRAVQDAATILWHHIHKYSDNFMLSLEENLPPGRGSRQQIEQVVINLISNALQALPDKRSGVSVATSFERAAGFIQVTIKDAGKGMNRKVLQRLTEPFFTTRSSEGGTGLGLYIAASIIKEHGGTMEFDSKPGKGTTATIRLPAA